MNKIKRLSIILGVIAISTSSCNCSTKKKPNSSKSSSSMVESTNPELHVFQPLYTVETTFVREFKAVFIDVGQADCILIMLPNGENMLVDAGDSVFDPQKTVCPNKKSSYDELVYQLGLYHITKLDYIVMTHPHADHVNLFPKLLSSGKYEFETLFLPFYDTSIFNLNAYIETYQYFANDNKDALNYYLIEANDVLISIPNLKIKVFGPSNKANYILSNNQKDPNILSIVMRIEYQNNSLLLTGDSGNPNYCDMNGCQEAIMVNQFYTELKSDVLKVGHHSSRYSTTNNFADLVMPTYSIIQLGHNNPYGFPTIRVLDTLYNRGSTVYQTDINGTIIMTSDGHNIEITPTYTESIC